MQRQFPVRLQINRYNHWNFLCVQIDEGWVSTDAPAESDMAFPAAVSTGNAFILYVNGTLADRNCHQGRFNQADYSHNVMLEGGSISMTVIRGKLDEIRISKRAKVLRG
jgi:hypothetical protein